ncbi:MAG TPA: flagellar biosynthetic protein FliR [Polyangiaceae bacterium]|nr:flagellar biosynthetic protein FliR [Polyangiaceae bacterium]
MPALDLLLQRELATLSLEVTRISGALVVAPLSWAVAPLRARGALVMLLAFVVHGQAFVSTEMAERPELVAMAIPMEFLVGVALGFVVRLVVATAEIAADVIAPQMGLGAAHLFDPTTRATQTPIGSLLRNFGIVLALLAGLHRVLVGGLLASFRALPPGAAIDSTRVTSALVEICNESLVAGVRIAMPVIAVLLLTQVALAFVSRAAPAMQVFSIGFAVTLGVGALVLGLSLPDFARIVQGEASHAEARIEAVLLAFGGP